MDLKMHFADKSTKPKEKTEQVMAALQKKELLLTELVEFAQTAKDPVKASCIEAVEWATREQPELADQSCFDFLNEALTSKTPRVKWESARALANIVGCFPDQLEPVTVHLLENAEHSGTVVRWSAANALAAILQLKTGLNTTLLPAAEQLAANEEKSSIRKLYLTGIKKVTK